MANRLDKMTTNRQKLSEEAVASALKRLQAKWPDGLWLFSNGQSVYLMRTHADGTRHIASGDTKGGMDPALIVASFQIPNDGGDW